MTALFSLLPIFGYALIFNIFLKRKVSVSIFFAISFIVVSNFMFGMVDFLKYGTFIIFYGGVLSLGYLAYNKRKDVVTFIKSVPFIIYIIASILYLYLMKDAQFFFWDEYSHWGAFIKEMYYFGHFYDANSVASHLRYPPGISIWSYFNLFSSSNFNEGAIYFAYFLILFSSVLMMYENLKWKQFYWIVLIFLAQMAIFATYGHWFSCIYVDHIIGALFVGLILTYLVDDFSENELLYFIFPTITIVLVKEVGLLFVLAFVGFVFILSFYNAMQNSNFINSFLKIKKIILICLSIFLLSYLILTTWNIRQDHIKIPKEGQTISGIIKNLTSDSKVLDTHIEDEVKSRFFEVVTYQQLHKEKISLNYNEFSYGIMSKFQKEIKLSTIGTFIFFILISLVFYFIVIDKKDRNKVLIINSYLLVVSIAYLIVLYFSYLVAFGNGALRIPSYVRYMNISILSLLFILFFVLTPASRFNYKKNINLIAFVSLWFLFSYITQPYYKPLYSQLENSFRKQIDNVIPKILEQVPNKSKILVVFPIKNNGSLNNILKYSMIPTQATITNYDFFDKKTEKEVMDEYGKYDYIWFTSLNNKIIKKSQQILRPKIKNQVYTLYKLSKQNNQLLVKPIL